MQAHERLLVLAAGSSSTCTAERLRIVRQRQALLHFRRRQARNCLTNSARPFLTGLRELGLVIGEVEEWARRAKFLPLNSIGVAGSTAISAVMARWRPRGVETAAGTNRRVGDLIVVFDERHKRTRREAVGASPRRCLCHA